MRKRVLFVTPIQEKYHFIGETIQTAIKIAVQEAEVDGKEVTPWILKRIGELSGGNPPKQYATLFISHCILHLPRFPDVAPIENALLIDTPPIHASVGCVLPIPRWSDRCLVVKLTVEQAVEVDWKLVSGFSLNSKTDPQSILSQRGTTK